MSDPRGDVELVFAGVAVSNYRRAAAWYRALLGREPDVIVVDDVECMWQIREGAWIYIVQDVKRAGSSLVTMLVGDLGEHLRELAGRGIEVPPMETKPGLYRKTSFVDPDGNTIAFGESLGEQK
ncbi:MAG TPA: VOC family protein [Candidatus Acidoferrales bacterium]|nr:VOC family protein [Candidatus Acidoferrales bacterium]